MQREELRHDVVESVEAILASRGELLPQMLHVLGHVSPRTHRRRRSGPSICGYPRLRAAPIRLVANVQHLSESSYRDGDSPCVPCNSGPSARRRRMTTLENRPNKALLVVDVQNGVVTGNHERDAVVSNVGSLVDKAREQGVPV